MRTRVNDHQADRSAMRTASAGARGGVLRVEGDEGSEAEATISIAMKDRAPFVKTGNSRI